MTNKQIELIQGSWDMVLPIADQAGTLFYQKLFDAAPGVRALFKQDIQEQSMKLMRMLSYIVSKLNRLDDIMDDITHLAASHNKYGALPEHYDVVGNCLIETLRDGLGSSWNNELEEAWLTVYQIIKTTMISAQNQQLKNGIASTSAGTNPMTM